MSYPPAAATAKAFDVVVIGGGVVGLSILRQATLSGYGACVVEREPDLAGWASGSNSGVVCTGVDAPGSSLERALIRDSISTIRGHCRALRVPIREGGSLVCAWPRNDVKATAKSTRHDDGDDGEGDNSKDNNKDDAGTPQGQTGGDNDDDHGLDEVLEQSHGAGDAHARRLGPEEVLRLEPALNHRRCRGAVHIPGEFVLDSWLYTISLAAHARENGATFLLDFDVDLEGSAFDEAAGVWTLVNGKEAAASGSASHAPRCVRGRAVVNATGAWSDLVEEGLAGGCEWMTLPRRGQYLVLAEAALHGGRQGQGHKHGPPLTLTRPIQPVPTLQTKGIFVFPSMYRQIVVGPTATEQASRDDRSPDPAVRQELLQVAKMILPGLDLNDDALVVGEYVGIRPATNRRDYQIRLRSRRHWVACAGIRSTGLTASLGIGRHVVHLLQQEVLPRNVEPLEPHQVRTTALPPLDDLVREFRKRKDGRVTIHGHEYKVTHPLTVMGWKGWECDDA